MSPLRTKSRCRAVREIGWGASQDAIVVQLQRAAASVRIKGLDAVGAFEVCPAERIYSGLKRSINRFLSPW